MSFLFFAWVASIVYGIEVVIGKFTSNNTVKNPWLFNFVWSLFVLVLIVPFAIANHASLPHFSIYFLLTTITYVLANILYILSLQMMDITAMGPLFNVRSVFSVLLGVFFLGETLSTIQVFCIAVIIVAGVLVNLDEKMQLKQLFQPGVAVLLLFLFDLSLMGVFTNRTIEESGFWATTLWSMVFAQILFGLTAPLFWRDMLQTPIKKYSGLFLMSLASAGGTLAANAAYAVNVGVTSVIMSLPFSMIFTIIISTIRPKLLEHHTAKIYALRILSAAIMLVAALQLSR